MNETKIYKYVLYGIGGALLLFFGFIFIRYLLPVLLPFFIAYLIASAVRPLASFLSKKTGIGKKVWSVILIIAIAAALGALFWFLFSTLIDELTQAMTAAGTSVSEKSEPLRKISYKVAGILQRANVIGEEMSLEIDIKEMLTGAASSLSKCLAGLIGKAASKAPGVIFFIVVTLLSIFYFTCDPAGVSSTLSRFIPKSVIEKAERGLTLAKSSLKGFARAYFSLFAITLVSLFVGFLFVRIDYPFLAALLCSIVDILPVFGVGTVLVPWAVILFLMGKTGKAIGLLVLFFVIYALRQILEPRLVGSAAGVHPSLALFFVYLGFRLFGVGGMIFAPVLLNAVSVFWEEKKKKTLLKVDKER